MNKYVDYSVRFRKNIIPLYLLTKVLGVKNVTRDAAFCTDSAFCTAQKNLSFLNKNSASFNLWSFSFALPASRKYIYIHKNPQTKNKIPYKQEKSAI